MNWKVKDRKILKIETNNHKLILAKFLKNKVNKIK